MRMRAAGIVLTGLAAVCGLSTACLGQRELNQRIQAAITASKLGSAKVGVSVRDLTSGMDVADLDADAPMKPASNMKLLTSGTALLVLGPEFKFRTELVLNGAPGSERLVIVGSGDPALADPAVLERMQPQVTVDSLVTQLVGAVKAAGITRVSEVIVDDRIFDRQWIHPTWPKDQLDRWYCAPVCGVNFHTNVLSVFPAPSADVGHPPVVVLEPAASWVEIDNKARTIVTGKNSYWMARQENAADANRFTLFGEVRLPAKQPMEITLAEVPKVTGQVFAAELVKQGIIVGSGATPSRDAALRAVRMAEAADSLTGRTVAVVTTHITDVLSRCNTDSHNLYAEAMIKRLGREVTGEPGSWTNGSSVVRMTIGQAQRLGPRSAAATVIVDGSGLSKDNRVSPATFTRWLDEMQRDKKVGEVFIESLATAEKGGLKRRFQRSKMACEINAKTGTIDEVRCLSGYLTEPKSGHRYSFSIMINGLRESMGEGPEALQCQERIVMAIDRWISGAPVRASATENAQ